MFYLIQVIFRLDPPLARRFRLSFVRPAAQVNLPTQIRSVIQKSWDDATCTLDLRKAYEHQSGIEALAQEVARLAFQSQDRSFVILANALVQTRVTVVDRIAALDDEHIPAVIELHHSTELPREAMLRKLAERYGPKDGQ